LARFAIEQMSFLSGLGTLFGNIFAGESVQSYAEKLTVAM